MNLAILSKITRWMWLGSPGWYITLTRKRTYFHCYEFGHIVQQITDMEQGRVNHTQRGKSFCNLPVPTACPSTTRVVQVCLLTIPSFLSHITSETRCIKPPQRWQTCKLFFIKLLEGYHNELLHHQKATQITA